MSTATAPIRLADIPENERLTFAQFQASGVDSDDLTKDEICELSWQGLTDPIPGRLYAGTNCYLQKQADGSWYAEWGMSFHSGTLAECEQHLYGFYVSEVAHDAVRDYLRSIMPPTNWVAVHPDTDESTQREFDGFQLMHDVSAGGVSLTREMHDWLLRWSERRAALKAPVEDAPAPAAAAAAFVGEDHPRYEDWKEAVANDETVLGLAAWVEHNPAEDADEGRAD